MFKIIRSQLPIIIRRKQQDPLIKTCSKLSTLSYIHRIGNDNLIPSTVGRILEKSAIKYDDKPAIISRHQQQMITFEDAYLQADKLAASLKRLGLNVGDRIGLWAPNCIEWYISMMACARGGYVMVALNPAYQESEIIYALNKVDVKALICPAQFKKQNYYDILTKFCNIECCIDADDLKSEKVPSLQSVILISNETFKGTYNYEELLNSADEETIKQIKKSHSLIQADTGFNIQFTSGTTGKAKAALLSHFNLVNNSREIAKRNELNLKENKICVQVPFFHAFGLCITIMAALHYGTTLVLPGLSYNPNESLNAIYEEKCNIIHGTPTMYVDLVDVQKKRLLDIHPEIAVFGGAPCSPYLINQVYDVLGVKKVKLVYGLTETTAVVWQTGINDDREIAANTIGQICNHVEAKVIDENGRIIAKGMPGELCIRSYANFLGYWDDEAKTKEIYGNDGWLKTGDQCVLLENGYAKIVGRIKDMIIRGGENIYPKEIEDILNMHPDVIESQVIGIDDERLGETVCACLRLKDNVKKELTLKDVQDYCDGKLSKYKIPTTVYVLKQFPKTTSGKIQKFKLKEMLKTKN